MFPFLFSFFLFLSVSGSGSHGQDHVCDACDTYICPYLSVVSDVAFDATCQNGRTKRNPYGFYTLKLRVCKPNTDKMTAGTDKFTAFRFGSAMQAVSHSVFIVLLSVSFVDMSVVFFFLSVLFVLLSGGVFILSGCPSYFCPDSAWAWQDKDKYTTSSDGSMKETDNYKKDKDKNMTFRLLAGIQYLHLSESIPLCCSCLCGPGKGVSVSHCCLPFCDDPAQYSSFRLLLTEIPVFWLLF